MNLLTTAFWIDTLERTLKVFAFATVAALGDGVTRIGVNSVPWTGALAVGATAAVLSVFGAISSIKIGTTGTASLSDRVAYVSPVVD